MTVLFVARDTFEAIHGDATSSLPYQFKPALVPGMAALKRDFRIAAEVSETAGFLQEKVIGVNPRAAPDKTVNHAVGAEFHHQPPPRNIGKKKNNALFIPGGATDSAGKDIAEDLQRLMAIPGSFGHEPQDMAVALGQIRRQACDWRPRVGPPGQSV